MSLNFGAASSFIQFSIGSAANAGNGAVTMIALWKPTFVSGSNSGLLAGQSSGTERRSFLIDTSALFGDGDFTSGVAISGTAGDWLWLAMSKAAGAAHYRMHWRNFTTGGAWTHAEAAGAANHTDPGASNEIRVGANATVSSSAGDVAVSAIKLTNMADLAIEAACTAALADLMAASPDWAVRFMNSAPSSIQDLTAGGGNETSRSGTITNSADPAGFSFDLAGAVVLGQRSTNRHPGAGPGRARFVRSSRPTDVAVTTAASGAGLASAGTSTSATGTKSVSGAGAPSGRIAVTSTGVRGATGAGVASARITTTDTGTKKATGAGTPTARTSTVDSGTKRGQGGGAPTARTSTTDSGVKKGAGAASASARTATSATTSSIPSGGGQSTAHTSTTSAGRHRGAALGAPSARTTTSATGVRKATGVGAPTARTSTAASGVHRSAGVAIASARTAVLSTGHRVVEQAVPTDWRVDAAGEIWTVEPGAEIWTAGAAAPLWRISPDE